jgi:hypothetical protein
MYIYKQDRIPSIPSYYSLQHDSNNVARTLRMCFNNGKSAHSFERLLRRTAVSFNSSGAALSKLVCDRKALISHHNTSYLSY